MKTRRAVQLSGLFGRRMVDDTGLEPVTPGM